MKNIITAFAVWCFSANSFAGGIIGGGGAVVSENSQLLSLRVAHSLYQNLRTVLAQQEQVDLQINESETITVKLIDDKIIDDNETVIIEPVEIQ